MLNMEALNFIFLGYLNPLLQLGTQRPLQQEDVGTLDNGEGVNDVYGRFKAFWDLEITNKNALNKPPSLWNALLLTCGYRKQLVGLFFSAIAAGCAFGPPLILKALSEHFSGLIVLSDSTLWIVIGLLFAIPVVGSISSAQSYVIFSHTSIVIRSAVIPAVFRKSLVVGSQAKVHYNTGQVTNLFSNDITNIQLFFQLFADTLFAPIQLGVALALVYDEVGVAMFAGFGLVFGMLPLMLVFFLMYAKNRMNKSTIGDARVKLTNEVLSGIRILKYYAWEAAFFDKLEDIRNGELIELGKMNMTMVLIVMGITSIPYVMPIVIFFTYMNIDNQQLDAGKAFTVIALLGIVTNQISNIPSFIQRYFQAKISTNRVREFLLCDEVQDYIQTDSSGVEIDDHIIFDNASLSWLTETSESPVDSSVAVVPSADLDSKDGVELTEKQPESHDYAPVPIQTSNLNRSCNTLIDLSVRIKKGQLVAVVGGVGSGKSSFLAALLGDLQLQTGSVFLRPGNLAYHAQSAWILNATVRDNIIFGLPYDEDKFKRAIDASCLQPDIDILPGGLETEIGEKGINLSGGQKARVSFARAVYREADLYLLDDPLSAVDAHVGEKMFKHGICSVLKNKTIVLVTHQVHFLDECDHIIVLQDGKISAQGTPQQIREAGIDFNIVTQHSHTEVKHVATEKSRSRSNSAVSDIAGIDINAISTFLEEKEDIGETIVSQVLNDVDDENLNIEIIRSRTNSTIGDIKEGEVKPKYEVLQNNDDTISKSKVGELMTVEERAGGSVPFEIYYWYFSKGGISLFCLCILIALGGSASGVTASFWLAEWGKESYDSYINGEVMSKSENVYYLNRYALLQGLAIAGLTIRTFFIVIFGLRASRTMHRLLLHAVLSTNISFFDMTPLGRILNRFSSDITQTDENLGTNCGFIMGMITNILGCIGALCYTTKGVAAILFAPLSMIYYKVQLYFRRANTELKRLENISRSPIYTDFNQALIGVTSLRAYKAEEYFANRMAVSVDKNSIVQILQQLIKWWLTIRLDVLGGAVSCFIAGLAAGRKDFIPAEYLSLALAQAFSMVGFMKWLVGMMADVEAMLNSVERVKYYSENVLDEETPEICSKYASIPESWPAKGQISATDLKMAYRDGPLVLKGVSFDLKEKEKVGIAGRTGCGKSSLMVALFRIENPKEGSITIDGIDTRTIPLKTLRSKIGIIPQDALVFSTTVRFNVDPFGEYSEEDIWHVLESVSMKNTILSLPLKLDEPVLEGGENFSVGQRQLLCIARVLLRKPKILVMDEATASVDNETDNLIQKTIREKFADCTVLTIAHRLHTILDADRIMVLDSGNLVEFDSAEALIAIEDGNFSGMWRRHQDSRHQNS